MFVTPLVRSIGDRDFYNVTRLTKESARNIMKEMKQGDYAFFYHSNCKVPGVVGIMEIVKEHSVDGSIAHPSPRTLYHGLLTFGCLPVHRIRF